MYKIPIEKDYTVNTKFNIDDLYTQYDIPQDSPIDTFDASSETYIYRQPTTKTTNAGRLLLTKAIEHTVASGTSSFSHKTYAFEKLPISSDYKLVLLCRGVQPSNPSTHAKYGHNQIMVDVTIQGKTKRMLATYSGSAHSPIGHMPPVISSGNIKVQDHGLAWYTIDLKSMYESVVLGANHSIT